MSRISNRDLYKCIYYGTDNEIIATDIYNLMLQDTEIGENIAIDNSIINYNMKHKNPMNEIYFYRVDNISNKVKLNENTIIYPSTFQETITMIIAKNNNEIFGPLLKDKYGLV